METWKSYNTLVINGDTIARLFGIAWRKPAVTFNLWAWWSITCQMSGDTPQLDVSMWVVSYNDLWYSFNYWSIIVDWFHLSEFAKEGAKYQKSVQLPQVFMFWPYMFYLYMFCPYMFTYFALTIFCFVYLIYIIIINDVEYSWCFYLVIMIPCMDTSILNDILFFMSCFR